MLVRDTLNVGISAVRLNLCLCKVCSKMPREQWPIYLVDDVKRRETNPSCSLRVMS